MQVGDEVQYPPFRHKWTIVKLVDDDKAECVREDNGAVEIFELALLEPYEPPRESLVARGKSWI
ncbi:hypothetical protein [Terricaulis silvestris]|uniref:Uncharacterized protein n=1 Tax=Terricaulis silvestris TaxID=2686094 RepID=A0A6I6MNI6_9CAUL|nr:hypothetical protein [Terricaulis silvestris]QGZ94886.1 hypothetical protein DSM104635_01719 [Terricaulis silvestris]